MLIKNTLSEYHINLIQKYVNENYNLLNFFENLRINDKLKASNSKGSSTYTINSITGDEITATDKNGNKIKFSEGGSYNEQTGMFDIMKINNVTKQATPSSFNVTNFDIIRNNAVVKSLNTDDMLKPEPEFERPTSNKPTNDVSEPIELNPTNTSGDSEEDKQRAADAEARAAELEKARDAVKQIVNDPVLQKAFYRPPGFMNLLMAELSGKKPTNKGIKPTLDLLNKYNTKILNREFIPNRKILFSLNKNIETPVTVGNTRHSFLLKSNLKYEATVQRIESDGGKTVIKGHDENNINYSIIILNQTSPTKNPDIYLCEVDVVGDTVINMGKTNVTFYKSNGYPSKNKVRHE